MYIIKNNMYTYSKDGNIRQLRGDSLRENEKSKTTCSPQTVQYENRMDKYNWVKWVLLFVIISLGTYLLCTSGGKKSKSKRL